MATFIKLSEGNYVNLSRLMVIQTDDNGTTRVMFQGIEHLFDLSDDEAKALLKVIRDAG